MNLSHIFNNGTKLLKSNSPVILTALGVSGVVTTAYLTAKGTAKAVRHVDEIPGELTPKEKIVETWKYYIPAVASGALTVTCIVGASHANTKRTAAAVTAYSLGERAFAEYREKVVEQIGTTKEQSIRDSVAQARVAKADESKVIITGGGDVLCCEMFTGRYFKSDMETLRRAENEINAKINRDLYVTLEEFYDILGLPHTSVSDNLGWNSDKLMKLEFSTVMSPDGVPCLAFNYNYTKSL